MYPGHDPDTFLCIYDTGIPLHVPFAPKMLTTPSIGSIIIAVATSIKNQYAQFLSNPHLVHLLPATTTLSPMREKWTDANPFWGESTNLGVVESKVPRAYEDRDGKRVLETEELVLALRQQGKRPMIHAWTIGGGLKLQVQVSRLRCDSCEIVTADSFDIKGIDVWEEEYLGKFLDEMLRCAMSIIPRA